MSDRQNQLDLEATIDSVLSTIDHEREREIVSRRFGLFDRKETLEQIGELLGITRERVRQLEKAIIIRLKGRAEQGQLPHLTEIEGVFITNLRTLGDVSRVSNLSARLSKE